MADLVCAPALPGEVSSFNPCHSFSTPDVPHIRTVVWCKKIPCARLENIPSNALTKGDKISTIIECGKRHGPQELDV